MDKETQNTALRTVIITIFLTGFVAAIYGFGIYLFSVILTDMKDDIGFSYAEAGFITGLAQISFLVFALCGGVISAKIGGGKTLIGSVLFSGIILLSIGHMNSTYTIGAALVMLGGMAASGYVPIVDILSRFINYQSRGKVMGLISSGTSYGVFLNGIIVPAFILDDGWREIWSVVGIITIIWVVGAFIIFYRFGIFDKNTVGYESSNEPKKQSIENGNVFSWSLVLICTLTFLNGFCVMPFQNFLAPFLREELGYTVTSASQVWSVIGFSGMMAGFLVGALADRIGTRSTLIMTYAFLAASSMLVLWHPSTGVMWLAAILFAFAFYPIFGLVPSYISKRYSAKRATTIFAIANVTLGIGGMVGNTAGGWLKTFTGTFSWVYVGVAIAALLACIITIALQPESQPERIEERSPEIDVAAS